MGHAARSSPEDSARRRGAAAARPEVNSREARRLATRDTILRAAADGFARRGYEHCSLDGIAQAAGVSKGLLLYHFRTKEDLLGAVERAIFADVLESVKHATDGVGPSLDQALWAMDQAWERLRTEESFLSIYLQAVVRAGLGDGVESIDVARFIDEHRNLLVEGARTTLGPLVDALPIGIESLADILLATLSGLAITRIQGSDPARADRAYTAFRSLLARVMGAH